MSRQTFRSSLPAILLTTLILVPFLGKAFTIDDTVFLFEANHALSDPLHPTAFEMNWDRVPERVSQIVPTGPVMAWLLIPSLLAGGSEWLAHVVQLAMVLIAIFATVSLALRFGLPPLWASASGLLLATTPAVLGMAGTAMPDVPAMTLGIAGIERLVAWRDDCKMHKGVLAAILLGLAPHARTHLLLLLGVATLLLVGDPLSRADWKKGPTSRWLPLAAAVLIMAVVSILTRDPNPGAGSVIGTLKKYSVSTGMVPNEASPGMASNIVAFSIHWVLVIGFAVPWTILRWRPILWRFWLFIASTGIAAMLLHLAHPGNAPYVLAPVAGLGVSCLIDVLLDAFQRRDTIQLTLGIWLFLSLPAVVYIHFPSKYLIASAPASALLLSRTASENPRLARYVLISTVAIGALLGVAILRADESFAEIGRLAGQKLVAPSVKAGRNVWYVGHWGFQWYAEKAGARCYNDSSPYPAVGDLLAYHPISSYSFNRRELNKMTFLTKIEDRERGGRVMSVSAGAGFYSNDWGYLPWAYSDGINDSVELWLIYPASSSLER